MSKKLEIEYYYCHTCNKGFLDHQHQVYQSEEDNADIVYRCEVCDGVTEFINEDRTEHEIQMMSAAWGW